MWRLSMKTTLAASASVIAMLAHATDAGAVSNEELLRIIRSQAEQIEKLNRRLDTMDGAARRAPAGTGATPSQTQIQTLERKVNTLEQKTKTAETDAAAARKQAEEAKKTAEASDLGVKFKWGPAPTIQSTDGQWSFKVRGRLFTDFNLVRSEDDPRDVGGSRIDTTSTELRAARLGVEGKIFKDFRYKLEADFADNEVDIKDAYMEYAGLALRPISSVRIGQYKTPNSLEEQTSARYTTFMERAAFTDAFDLDRRIGAGVGSKGENWTADVGLFSQNNGENSSSVTEGYAAAGRGTYAFTGVAASQDLLHTGASVRYRNLDNDVDNDQARYRQRPFFHDTNRSVDTGNIDNASADLLGGLELAYVTGPFSIQGEAATTWVDRDSGSDDLYGLWGGYISPSYFLTGESRAKSYKGGKFNRIKVNNPIHKGGWGAWELAGRFDYIDLNSNDSRQGDNARGGEQYSGIFGVNWYLNNYMRMMANYAYTRVFNARDMGGNQVVGSSNVINGFGLRGQVDF